MKLYSAKSSVKRAAKKEGLTEDQYEIFEIDGKFGYQVIAEEAEQPVVGEFVNCPHCDIHLSNGYGVHGDDVNGETIKHEEFEYVCLGCGEEFGPAIKKARKVVVTNHSTVERPTKLVWHIADEMFEANPEVRRKDVIAECVNRGIAFYTARTQYQQWLTATRNSSK
jgi:DNA-directed RNA polymerase subunit RPC12/RpoP